MFTYGNGMYAAALYKRAAAENKARRDLELRAVNRLVAEAKAKHVEPPQELLAAQARLKSLARNHNRYRPRPIKEDEDKLPGTLSAFHRTATVRPERYDMFPQAPRRGR